MSYIWRSGMYERMHWWAPGTLTDNLKYDEKGEPIRPWPSAEERCKMAETGRKFHEEFEPRKVEGYCEKLEQDSKD